MRCDVELALVFAVVVIALAFDYTNDFHDAANAIAASISTRALTPRIALLLAAVMNLVGALVSEGVAGTAGSGTITPSEDGALDGDRRQDPHPDGGSHR